MHVCMYIFLKQLEITKTKFSKLSSAMKPEKFLKSYKCDCFQPHNYCNCMNRIVSSDILMENIADIAESLLEVMRLCGICMAKSEAISDIITYYFLHFEEIMHRIDSIPRKRLNKEYLIHDLGRNCSMNRRETQMAYSIIKRAFKAFYYGTGVGGVPNILLKDQLTHTAECLWAHAAKRTAQIYATYEGIFYAAQKDLECKIKWIYKQLYDRILSTNQMDDDHDCFCIKCTKRIARETLNPMTSTTDFHLVAHPYEVVFLEEQAIIVGKQNVASLSTGKLRCSCPSLNMTEQDYAYRENADKIRMGPRQNPFECRWFPIAKEEYEADEVNVDMKLPQDFPSPPCHSVEENITEYEDCSSKSDCEMFCDAEVEADISKSSENPSILNKSSTEICDNAEILIAAALSWQT